MKWGEFKKMVESLDGKDDHEIEIHFTEMEEYGYSWLRKFRIESVMVLPVDKSVVISGEEIHK